MQVGTKKELEIATIICNNNFNFTRYLRIATALIRRVARRENQQNRKKGRVVCD